MSELGFSSHVWIQALFKRIIDGVSGHGGIEAFCQYFDQIDFIPELTALSHRMKANSIYFETALAKCNKEMLKRPKIIREREISNFMGAVCPSCHRQTSIWSMCERDGQCRCGGMLELSFVKETMKLVKNYIDPTPETVMMSKAYDKIAAAYVDAYKGLYLVMSKTAQAFNWGRFRLEDPQLRNYLDNYFLGRISGEQQIPREEKQILQFIVRGNLAGIEVTAAEKLIRRGIEVVKYGYLYEVLGATGTLSYYQEQMSHYTKLYNSANKTIREVLAAEGLEPKHRTVQVTKSLGASYVPCLIMPRTCWETGRISSEIHLDPLHSMPIFAKVDEGALNLVFAPVGKGKTTLLSSLISYSYLSKHELIFVPLSDRSNSLSFASMPLFEYDARTAELVRFLRGTLGVEPQAIPTLTLTFLLKSERNPDARKHAPTIYDRVIEIKDPHTFEVDFTQIVDELRKISESYFGVSKSAGIITVRNLERTNDRDNTNLDVQIATSLMSQFSRWRKSHLTVPARQVIDELSYLASSQNVLYAADTLRSAATLSDIIKESRRDRVSVDAGTQDFLEVPPDIRTANTNIFFRELPASKDKSKSPIDFLLHSLQLREPEVRSVIRSITEQGLFTKTRYWFWYNKANRSVEVVRPCPPVFCLHDTKKNSKELLKTYEKHTNENIMVTSWDEVPILEAVHLKKKKYKQPDSIAISK